MSKFVNVILPFALQQEYTYSIPIHLQDQLQSGMRVLVQFGKRKVYTGIAADMHNLAPEGYKTKDILDILDDRPIVLESQLKLWKWIASYYMCAQGDVMNAALPAGMKLESETCILLNRNIEILDEELSDLEYLIIEALGLEDRLSIDQIKQITEIDNPMKILHELLGKHFIIIEESIANSPRRRQKKYIKLHSNHKASQLKEVFESLASAHKQKDLLMSLLQLSNKHKHIPKSNLLKASNAGESSLKSLAEKEIVEIYELGEFEFEKEDDTNDFKKLSDEQNVCLNEVISNYETKDVCLLQGVTSSGKTEVYVHLMQKYIDEGKQCLFLLPEIALTTQLIIRLQKYFGQKLAVYHSRFTERERLLTWQRLLDDSDNVQIVIGARSSLFLPFKNLGLIIVDEEHETSFKQHSPAPRYHARDSAIMMAHQHNAKVLLGSATPSFETMFRAKAGKYGLSILSKRYSNIALPEIQCIDLKKERKFKRMRGAFSDQLIEEIKDNLKRGKQIIIFQNRRGFSSFVQCNNCGHVSECKNCDLSLTYHKHSNELKCHSCSYTKRLGTKCPACSSFELQTIGLGTEKIEEDLNLLIEGIRIQRMDFDTTRKKNAYLQIIEDFEERETDVLVGTQMVTKGLDFENVGLVAVINADGLLHFPDFRAHERAYQLMSQVAGRAGRKGERGKVLIQTADPYHHVIRRVMDSQLEELYTEELQERKIYKYPPYTRLIKLILKHRDREKLERSAKGLELELRPIFGDRLLGPEFPIVQRLRNQYHMEFLLKLEEGVSLTKSKNILREKSLEYNATKAPYKFQILFDVDPI